MVQWSEDDPAAGDMSVLEDIARYLKTSRDLLRLTASSVQSSGQDLKRSWTGSAADAWMSRASDAYSGIRKGAEACNTQALAMKSYVDNVKALQERQTRLENQRQRALDLLAGTRVYVVPARTGVGGTDPITCQVMSPGTMDPVEEAKDQALARQVESAFNATVADWQKLVTDRARYDAKLIEALHNATPGWEAQSRAFTGIGITDPSKMTTANLVARTVQVVRGMAAGGTLSAGDLDCVQAALAAIARNGAGDEFFRRLGGAGCAAYLTRLNATLTAQDRDRSLTVAMVVDHADRFRAGLANASQGWDTTQAQTFATGLIPDHGDVSAGTYLLAGQKVGANLANAAALRVDMLARVKGVVFGYGTRPALLDYERVGHSISSAAFEQLGKHPAQAAAFLDDPTHSTARIDYWYTRPQAYGVGVLGLWAGAQHAPGGPTDPNATTTSMKTVEGRNSRIINALYTATQHGFTLTASNSVHQDAFSSHVVNTDKAAGYLAKALSPELMWFVEDNVMTQDDLTEGRNAGKTMPVSIFGGAERPSAYVSQEAVRALMGMCGTHKGSAQQIASATNAFDGYLRATTKGNPVNVAAARGIIARMHGLAVGSTASSTIEAAQYRDTVDAGNRKMLIGLVGFIPTPYYAGGGQLPQMVADAVSDRMATHYTQTAITNADRNKSIGQAIERRALLNEAIASLGWNTPIPTYGTNADSDFMTLWNRVKAAQQNAGIYMHIGRAMQEWSSGYTYGHTDDE